ncbi:hypothetical protein C8R46DRAFT_1238482 [Mycena filopes]|nr:hypothetical protein C8R46DRAFT_1238482 [Mycena filopes]
MHDVHNISDPNDPEVIAARRAVHERVQLLVEEAHRERMRQQTEFGEGTEDNWGVVNWGEQLQFTKARAIRDLNEYLRRRALPKIQGARHRRRVRLGYLARRPEYDRQAQEAARAIEERAKAAALIGTVESRTDIVAFPSLATTSDARWDHNHDPNAVPHGWGTESPEWAAIPIDPGFFDPGYSLTPDDDLPSPVRISHRLPYV